MKAGSVQGGRDWKTKPSDRFVLKWIKLYLSSKVTPILARFRWITPLMITCTSTTLGVAGGILLGLGYGWQGGILAAVGQVFDGVDGQLARLTSRESHLGGFLDSVLDRYSDGFLVVGLTVFALRIPSPLPPVLVGLIGTLAFISCNSVSYSAARAANLGVDLKPTLASKGTRTTVIVLTSLATALWPAASVLGILYLAIHPTLAVARRGLEVARNERGNALTKKVETGQ